MGLSQQFESLGEENHFGGARISRGKALLEEVSHRRILFVKEVTATSVRAVAAALKAVVFAAILCLELLVSVDRAEFPGAMREGTTGAVRAVLVLLERSISISRAWQKELSFQKNL